MICLVNLKTSPCDLMTFTSARKKGLMELVISIRFLELQPHRPAFSTPQLYKPMNRLPSHSQLPRIFHTLLRSPSTIRTFTMASTTAASAPAQTSYKPRYIDVRPSSPPPGSAARANTQSHTVDRHQPHRSRIYRPLPRHATASLRPACRCIASARCRMQEADCDGL